MVKLLAMVWLSLGALGCAKDKCPLSSERLIQIANDASSQRCVSATDCKFLVMDMEDGRGNSCAVQVWPVTYDEAGREAVLCRVTSRSS
jgi:hypothetical protein